MSFAGRQLCRCKPAILPAIDETGELPRRPAFLIDAMRFDDLLEETDLVIVVKNGEAGLETGKLGMASQNLDADRVEGAEPDHSLDHPADEPADAVPHLARRFVRERDTEDLAGPCLAGCQDVGEPGGQDPRLAGAGAGKNKKRALGR